MLSDIRMALTALDDGDEDRARVILNDILIDDCTAETSITPAIDNTRYFRMDCIQTAIQIGNYNNIIDLINNAKMLEEYLGGRADADA